MCGFWESILHRTVQDRETYLCACIEGSGSISQKTHTNRTGRAAYSRWRTGRLLLRRYPNGNVSDCDGQSPPRVQSRFKSGEICMVYLQRRYSCQICLHISASFCTECSSAACGTMLVIWQTQCNFTWTIMFLWWLSLPQTHHLLPNVRSELVEKVQQSAKTDSLHSHTGGAIPHLWTTCNKQTALSRFLVNAGVHYAKALHQQPLNSVSH